MRADDSRTGSIFILITSIDGKDGSIIGYSQTPRTSKFRTGPLVDILSVQTESLNTSVVPICDEKSAVDSEGQAVRIVELTGSVPRGTPRGEQVAVLCENCDS